MILIGKWPYSTRNENCYNPTNQTNSNVVSGILRGPDTQTYNSWTANINDQTTLYCDRDQLQASPNSDRQLVCDSGDHDQQLACPHQCESLSVARLHHREHGHVHPSHGLHVSSDVCAGEDCGLTGGLVGGTTRQLDSAFKI